METTKGSEVTVMKGSKLDWISEPDGAGIRRIMCTDPVSEQKGYRILLGRQPIVFIVGALRHKDKIVQDTNVLMATKLARRYWEDGWAVICPHLNGGYFDSYLSDDLVMSGHITLLLKCDLVAVVESKYLDGSHGSKGEIEMADTAGIPIVWEKVNI
jgi:hypothetical protein